MTKERQAELKELFKTEVFDKESNVDPNQEQDWHSLTLGWAIGKGETVENAHDFANYLRYYTDLA